MRDGSLLTQLFDERRLELLGESVPIADQVGSFLLPQIFRVGKRRLNLSRGENSNSGCPHSAGIAAGQRLGYASEPGTYAYAYPTLRSPEGTLSRRCESRSEYGFKAKTFPL
jgi:hypothetical protein